MSLEENKAIARALVELYNRGDAEGSVEYDAPDVTLNGQPFGRQGDLERSLMMIAAFPDGEYSIDDLFGEGDRVTLRWTFRGTHQGELKGIPPTGKPVEFAGISVYRFADGKLVEVWEGFDRLALLQQLGVVPT